MSWEPKIAWSSHDPSTRPPPQEPPESSKPSGSSLTFTPKQQPQQNGFYAQKLSAYWPISQEVLDDSQDLQRIVLETLGELGMTRSSGSSIVLNNARTGARIVVAPNDQMTLEP